MPRLQREAFSRGSIHWNWNTNALAILGDVLRRTPGVPPGAFVSKKGLQVLYYLRNRVSCSEVNLVQALHNWEGTGKHTVASMGSPTSYAAILQQLRDAGLVTRKFPQTPISLTLAGTVFLELLHPDCYDQDMPGRLETWIAEGLPTSRTKIDRYILAFFGRQLRKNKLKC